MKKLFAIISVLLIAVSLNAQGKFAVSVNGDVALPMGTFGDAYKMGFGGLVAGIYNATENIQVTLKSGYLTWTGEVNDNMKFNSVPAMVGARYVAGKGKLKPYGAAELGLHFLSMDIVTPSFTNPLTGQTIGGTRSESTSEFGFGFGGGTYYEVSPKIDLELNAQYNIISTSGSSSGFINIGVGAVVHF